MMLTEQSGINLVPDETVKDRVTLDLKNVEVQETMRTLTIAYGYNYDKIDDNIYLVSKEDFNVPANIKYKDDLLSISVLDGDVGKS